ncbi:5932_t:CDS:2 [Entrophospora sp. SA101]|nr:5932_t:CDS:2 [Entrophospora sp. SA101]
MSYVKNLEYLKENSKECQQPAEYILVGDSGVHPSLSIKYEKMSEDVNSFWQSINMKKQLDIKKLQCAGNALDAITNETHLRSVVMSEIISIMKHPLEHSDDVYHNEIGSNVIIPRNQVISTNKRKREDQSDYEESALLFDKSNEDTIMENIDEKTLEQEIKLPLASVNSSLKVNLNVNS